MFRDAQEELKRLERELLAEEEEAQTPEEEGEEEEELTQEELEQILELLDEKPESAMDMPEDYDAVRNYDGQVRNFANNYTAYNADRTDTELESYSREVREGSEDRSLAGLSALALALMAGILGVLVWWLVRYQGLL